MKPGAAFRQPLSPGRWTARSAKLAVARKGGRTVSRMSGEEEVDADLPQLWASSLSTKKELVPAIAEVRLGWVGGCVGRWVGEWVGGSVGGWAGG